MQGLQLLHHLFPAVSEPAVEVGRLEELPAAETEEKPIQSRRDARFKLTSRAAFPLVKNSLSRRLLKYHARTDFKTHSLLTVVVYITGVVMATKGKN